MRKGPIAVMILGIFAVLLARPMLFEKPSASGAAQIEQGQCCRTGYAYVHPRDQVRHSLKCNAAYEYALQAVKEECPSYTSCATGPNKQTYYTCEVELCCS